MSKIAALTLFAVMLCAPLDAQETVRFRDNFQGFSGWSVKDGLWKDINGQMVGRFIAFCNDDRPWCPEGDMLLNDEHQPRTADWRMDVDFLYYENGSPWSAVNTQGAKAMFSLWTDARHRETYSIGSDDFNAVLPTATAEVRSFGPWTKTSSTSVALTWDSTVFNTASLEKRGDVYSFYLNGQLFATKIGSTLSGSPKLGLHVTGGCWFNNFKLTEIGPVPTYAISGTVRTPGGVPVAGATVVASPGGATATTSASGAYVLNSLGERTTYTLTPAYADALGAWTFTQPISVVTISGANGSRDFVALAPGAATETVRYSDDFSGELSNWVLKGLGKWGIANGHLMADYPEEWCGNPEPGNSTLCLHSFLLLADPYQPRTSDWRMEADFMYVHEMSVGDANVQFARWSSDSESEMYYIGWDEQSWNGAPLTTARWMQQTHAPTWLAAYRNDVPVPRWIPGNWNHAALEKRGDLFYFYLNGQLLGVEGGSILTGNPKVGLHIYQYMMIDNFKLTELGMSQAPVATADLSLSQTTSAAHIGGGGQVQYTLSVMNHGPATVPTVTVTDALPAGATFVSASGVGWNCSPMSGTVTCTLASLAVGTAPPIVITVTAPSLGSGTSLLNVAMVTSAIMDPVSENNSSTAIVELEPVSIPAPVPALDPGMLALLGAALAVIAAAALRGRV